MSQQIEPVTHLAVIGASGRIGRRLLRLLAARGPARRMRLLAVANSRASLIGHAGLDPLYAAERLGTSARVPGEAFAQALLALPRPLTVVDCTANAQIAAHYPRWLAAGIDIVTPNKHGPSADRALFAAMAAAQCASGACLRDAATVGAQLPLLDTLRALHQAGDRVERFEAVLSGTLSFVLGRIAQGEAFSAAVREAVDLGYAEPDPGADLSGEDAARKLVILLRALGHDIELAEVETVSLAESLAPQELAQIDEQWRARAAIAAARNERWIYRASFDGARARVAPERVVATHPLALLAPCENALILHSAYYHAAPLTIAGPGAGVELTAAAVFADLLASARAQLAQSTVEAAA
ncbi:MAG: homoserine dehydrogenase [Rudaea sp.]